MSGDQPSPTRESSPTMACRACGHDVAVGAFCGDCGATRSTRRGDGPDWLRLSAYAAAPDTSVSRPSITSTLFPRLPRHSRTVFAVALIGLVVVLAVTAAVQWQAPLIGIVTAGLPLLFLAYLAETDAFQDLSVGALLITAVLGNGLGVGWALGTDAAVARTEDDALGLPVSVSRILFTGLGIPLGFVILLLVPVIAVRFLRPGTRESLNGFAIGSLGAYCFTAAGTLTRSAPQFTTGPVAGDDRSATGLMIAASIQGLAVPLTAAAVAGSVGATLWFTRRAEASGSSRWYGSTSPATSVGFGVLVYLGLGLIDFGSVPSGVEMGLYALVAVLALYVQRLVVHSTLLHETPDGADPDEPMLCPQCEHVVPDLPFCPSCGVAGHAASRSSRRARRSTRPVPVSLAAEGP